MENIAEMEARLTAMTVKQLTALCQAGGVSVRGKKKADYVHALQVAHVVNIVEAGCKELESILSRVSQAPLVEEH